MVSFLRWFPLATPRRPLARPAPREEKHATPEAPPPGRLDDGLGPATFAHFVAEFILEVHLCLQIHSPTASVIDGLYWSPEDRDRLVAGDLAPLELLGDIRGFVLLARSQRTDDYRVRHVDLLWREGIVLHPDVDRSGGGRHTACGPVGVR